MWLKPHLTRGKSQVGSVGSREKKEKEKNVLLKQILLAQFYWGRDRGSALQGPVQGNSPTRWGAEVGNQDGLMEVCYTVKFLLVARSRVGCKSQWVQSVTFCSFLLFLIICLVALATKKFTEFTQGIWMKRKLSLD